MTIKITLNEFESAEIEFPHFNKNLGFSYCKNIARIQFLGKYMFSTLLDAENIKV